MSNNLHRIQYFLVVAIWILFQGCNQNNERKAIPLLNDYAGGFEIREGDGFTRLTVKNPWEQARNVSVDYYLVDKNSSVPESLSGKTIIRTPVEKIICMSTTHLAYLDQLGQLEKITGISGSQYVSHPEVRDRITSGEIKDVGYGQNINYEEIIRQNPDLVMMYGVDSEITGIIQKFKDLGIPAILNAEYLEPSPLGKAEWIRFMGAFFAQTKQADSIFKGIETRYNQMAVQVAGVSPKPSVMVGLPYRDAWWVPGGESYLAHLITDAGGNYLGKENSSHESYVVSFEEALLWASRADVWINTGTAFYREDILAADPRFENFGVFKKGQIFNNNRRTSPEGGNDFWESGSVAPDAILSDLIRIFHPSILVTDTLIYYREVGKKKNSGYGME